MWLTEMLQWVWFLELSWEGKVDSKNGLPGKQKLGATLRLKWGQDVVYMILYNSPCQLLVFAACHYLYPPSPTVQWNAKTVRHSGSERCWHSLKTYLHGLFYFTYQSHFNFIGSAQPMQANETSAENISYVYIMIPNALPPGWQESSSGLLAVAEGAFSA